MQIKSFLLFAVSFFACSLVTAQTKPVTVDANDTNFLANSGKVLIGWNRTAGAGETDLITNQGPGNTGGFAFYNHDNSNTEKQLMWLKRDGKLILGPLSNDMGSYKLAVGGSILGESLTVRLLASWPDYVFKPDYHLPVLKDLKAFIDENQHLPEIPSAQQIAEAGHNIGEMNKLMLKKVEELTLYLIENDRKEKERDAKKDRQLNILERKVAKLQKKIDVGLLKDTEHEKYII